MQVNVDTFLNAGSPADAHRKLIKFLRWNVSIEIESEMKGRSHQQGVWLRASPITIKQFFRIEFIGTKWLRLQHRGGSQAMMMKIYNKKSKYFYLDALKFLLMNFDSELPSILKLERRLVLEISDSKEVSWDGDNTGAEL